MSGRVGDSRLGGARELRGGVDDGTGETLSVLHVDDDEGYREATAGAFADQCDASLTGAGSVAEARTAVESGEFDCVLLDYSLPDGTGVDLLREDVFGETPVVLLTGQGSESLASEAIAAGVADYYAKGNGADGVREVVAAVERHARRHRRERQLERARRRYELVADVVTDAVFEWFPERGAVAVEDETALGYDTAEGPFDESWWLERVHPDDRESAVAEAERTRERGDRRLTHEYRFQRADGEYADVRVTSRFVYEDGEVVYAVGALRDVSDRKARERELERQNERLDRFASVVSHDLRNPLAVAQGYLQLAEETGDAEHFERTAGALDRIGELVDDLLELARTGRGVGELGPVLLSGVATEAWENVETGDARLGLPDDLTVQADRARLRQLFENLFRNSMEHGDPDDASSLTVSVGPLEDAQGFYVADDGVGFPDGMRERLFETGVTGSDDGTGFGLAIVREIAESHGWEATATNGTEGGARFEFSGVTLD